jgi:two-component system cell cycle response regulator CtrA
MRILYAEYDPTTTRSVEIMLTNAGFTVYSTDMVEEALDLAKLYDYDLILTETDFGGEDAIDGLIRPLRLDRYTTPILILPGS